MSINQIEIPTVLNKFFELQENLTHLFELGQEKVFLFIQKNWDFLSKSDSKTLSFEIYWIYTIRPTYLNNIIGLCSLIFSKITNFEYFQLSLMDICLKKAPILIYKLYKLNYYKIEQIMEHLKSTYDFSSILIFSEDIIDCFDYLKTFNDEKLIDEYLFYKNNYFEDLHDLQNFGWVKNSIGYFIKFDIIDKQFEKLNKNEEILWSNFEILPKPKKLYPIHISILFGSLKCFEYFLKNNFIYNEDIIQNCIISNNFEIITKLNELLISYSNCLIWSVYFRYDEIFDILIEKGFKNEINLSQFIEYNYIKAILYSVKNGETANSKSEFEWTPLHSTSNSENIYLTKFLISIGSNLDEKDSDGWAPIHWSVDRGNLEITKLLIENGANINILDSYGWTPLHWAVQFGHYEVTKYLIEKGCNINVKSFNISIIFNGYTPLHRAAINGFVEIFKLLINNGADLTLKEDVKKNFILLIMEKLL